MAVDANLLKIDLINAEGSPGYNRDYYIRLVEPTVINPIRVYLSAQGHWWGATVTFTTYPVVPDWEPDVLFDLIPPCPVHSDSWHPNIWDRRKICWGTVHVLPNTRLIGVLNVLSLLLANPNHNSPVPNRCGR